MTILHTLSTTAGSYPLADGHQGDQTMMTHLCLQSPGLIVSLTSLEENIKTVETGRVLRDELVLLLPF